jgi:hypothetical protein
MCRHLAAESLAAALSSEVPYNTNAARVDAMDVSPESITSAANTAYGLLDRLVPFLTLAPPPANKKTQGSLGESRISAMVLTDAEDASLWLLSRLGPEHAGSQPGALLLALIQDAEKIMLPSSIVTASVDPQSASQLLDDFPGYVDLITSVFDIWLLPRRCIPRRVSCFSTSLNFSRHQMRTKGCLSGVSKRSGCAWKRSRKELL